VKHVLAALLVASLACLAIGCNDGGSDVPRELKLAYVMAPGGPADDAAKIFAELVKEKSGGQLTVKLYPSAQLGNDRELAEALMIGSVDLVVGGTAPIGWYLPQYGAIEAPFSFRDYEHLDNVLGGEIGGEIADAFLKAKGIRILDWWHRGPRYLTTTSRKITRLDDLKGLKLRVPELPTYIETWRILGTNPTPVTYSEIFMALKQGIVEGQENPLEVIYTSSFHEAQKYCHATKHLLGVYMMMVNDRLYQSLPEDQRKALADAAVEAGKRERELMIKYDEEFVAKLKDKGMEFVELDMEPFRKLVVSELPKRFEGKWAPRFFQRIVETK